ncbi:response regulator transcription factor [Carboxylicivirga sp. M1479]|uniref:response regulator transcription factor n=1 Tax=Carboxylicivirga sp. M1479 TaxID=2594476 RepID=UPI00117751BB|nr:response regulator transcription factor [Carboxylicivirga sp. M1479]TRX70686.1 response regulator transcription factor [Carboxylicivirga sp. M1479]
MGEDIKRILIVDDEEDLCEILQFNLESEGYQTEVAYSAEEALQKDLRRFNLLLLDVMMGGMSGFKLIDIIRNDRKVDVPVIFLTAKSAEDDLLTGFDLGADDYITKPYSLKELIARVKVALKRSIAVSNNDQNELQFKQMILNLETKRLVIDGQMVELTLKEFQILRLLFENKNKIYSRDEILEIIWGDSVVVTNRTVDVNITRLRKKLKQYGECLKNRAGIGYYFETLQ